jgi:hypothetical protein
MSVAIPQFMKKMRTKEAARDSARETEHCRSRSADPGVLVEGSLFLLSVCCA